MDIKCKCCLSHIIQGVPEYLTHFVFGNYALRLDPYELKKSMNSGLKSFLTSKEDQRYAKHPEYCILSS